MPTKSKKPAFPQFKRFSCQGDCIQWEHEGYDFVARLEHDTKCYSEKDIAAWKNGQWFFAGVIISVSKNDVQLNSHAASLWGIECNFPSRKKNPNAYLSEVALELQDQALEAAKLDEARIIAALS